MLLSLKPEDTLADMNPKTQGTWKGLMLKQKLKGLLVPRTSVYAEDTEEEEEGEEQETTLPGMAALLGSVSKKRVG